MKTTRSIKFSMIFAILALISFSAKAYEWDKTISMQGRGIRQTSVFPLVGEKWRVRFVPKSKSNVKVEILDENGKVIASPIIQRNLDMPWTASGEISKSLKSAALRIEGSINGWSCTFEQYVTKSKGWELYKWHNDINSGIKLEKFAMWTGDASDEIEIPVSVESKKWRVFFETFESGKVNAELVDSNGKCHFLNYHLDKGTSDGWIFSPGEYILKVSSVGSSWAVSFEADKGFSTTKFVNRNNP